MLKLAKAVVQRMGNDAATGAPARGKVHAGSASLSIPSFVVVTAQLALVMWAMHLFQIETKTGFDRLFPLIFGGFIINAWLPLAFRVPFFVGLSFAGIYMIFGAVNSLWLIGIGLGLIGLCHLPITKWMRVTLVVLAGAVLTAMRGDLFSTSWSVAILPILGSMFMFRLALYLYDMDSEKKKASIWERLAYFFMLPNTVFPFFPIVDYIIFRRSYYNKDAISIYQKGVLWMLRGAIHLILYRLVYYYFTPAVEDVQGLSGVLLFITSAYLLYLRVSGLFHLIIGIMCLFGFNLPETHKHYFLASSFNDYWRRINIYWKDFMMKLFFYPIFMKTRSWGTTNALVFSTLLVFLFTWLLHSYQWFWLQGDFPLTTVDGVYWGVLGVLVAINSVWEAKAGKKKRLTKTWSWKPVLSHTFFVVITFVFLSIMWSFWSSHGVSQWVTVMSQTVNSTPTEWIWLAAGLVGLYTLIVLKEWLEAKGIYVFFDEEKMRFSEVAGRTTVMALAVVLIGMPQVQHQFPPQTGSLIASLQESRLSDRDQAIEERGYYEGLMDTRSYTSQLSWSQQNRPPEDWKPIMETNLVQPGNGVLIYELSANLDETFKDASFKTNRWGMRDQDYEEQRSPNTLRIALLGASYEQGAGVEQHQTFEAVLEDSLNAYLAGSPYDRYEVLNFATGGYSPVQNVAVAEEKMKAFQPDIVLYAMYSTEERRMFMQLENIIQQKRELPYPFLNDLIAESGATPDMAKSEIRTKLRSYDKDLLGWSFEQIASTSNEIGAKPIALLIPTTRELGGIDSEWGGTLMQLAREAGFNAINLEGAYGEFDEELVALAPWDQHPSVLGHRLIARSLYNTMIEQPEMFLLNDSSSSVIPSSDQSEEN